MYASERKACDSTYILVAALQSSCVYVGCSPKCKQQIQEFKARESTAGSGNRKFSAHAIWLEYRAGGGALRHLAKGVGRGRLRLKNPDLEGLVNCVKESRL